MSEFDNMYGMTAAPVMLHIMGDSITYEDDELDPVTVTAIQSAIQVIEEDVEAGQQRRYTTIVSLTTDPTGQHKGVADPRIGGIVTINGLQWTVTDVLPKSPSMVILHLLRVGSIERTRGDLRRGQ